MLNYKVDFSLSRRRFYDRNEGLVFFLLSGRSGNCCSVAYIKLPMVRRVINIGGHRTEEVEKPRSHEVLFAAIIKVIFLGICFASKTKYLSRFRTYFIIYPKRFIVN